MSAGLLLMMRVIGAGMTKTPNDAEDTGAGVALSSEWKGRRWQWWVPVGASLIFAAVCWATSAKKLMWGDEILTQILVSSETIAGMFRAVASGIDGSPPVYWLLLRGWTKLVGTGDLALRLFSALAMSVAFTASWVLVRRLAGFSAATIACSVVFFSNYLVFLQATECRHYPVVMAILALTLLQFERVNRRATVTRRDFLIYAGLVAALVLTHLFGFIFSGFLLGAQVLGDAVNRRFRPAFWLAIPCGWLAFLPWIPIFREQSKIGKPWFWIEEPDVAVLADPYSYVFGISRFALVAALVMIAFYPRLKKGFSTVSNQVFQRRSLDRGDAPLIFAGALLVAGVPIATLALSLLVQPMWLNRYQLPGVLGWTLLLGLGWRRVIGVGMGTAARRLWWRLDHGLGAVLVAICVLILVVRVWALPSRPGTVHLKTEGPVAVQGFDDFLYLTTYQPQLETYYILDWPSALTSAKANRGYVAIHNIMAALKRNYPQLRIVDSREFAERFKRFDIVEHGDSRLLRNWLAQYPDRAVDTGLRRKWMMPNQNGLMVSQLVVRVDTKE